jgi:hypothetical protein
MKSLSETVVPPLMELRAYFSDINRIATAAKNNDVAVFSDMSEDYMDSIAANYSSFYGRLRTMMADGTLNGYSSDVVREHLLSMGEWLKPERRYNG